jgi:hypothetical protein
MPAGIGLNAVAGDDSFHAVFVATDTDLITPLFRFTTTAGCPGMRGDPDQA